jgi:N-acetylneuraminic acid mutarotase
VTLVPVVAFGGDLWMTSQTHAFSSADGLAWRQHDKEDWGERIGQAFAFFGERLWMLGGLDYKTKRPLGDAWSSVDGVRWRPAGAMAWPERTGAAVLVFKGKLWVIGGTAEVDARFDAVRTLADVWSSADGLSWTRVTAAAPWGPRAEPRVVALGDALYLLGGGGTADVWRSEDGERWTRLMADAPWRSRHGYGAAAFDGRLWVFGGWVGSPTAALNDVWWSPDGATWTLLADHSPWGPRSPRWVVFRDRLWIFSGKHTGGADSWGGDVWALPTAQQTCETPGLAPP